MIEAVGDVDNDVDKSECRNKPYCFLKIACGFNVTIKSENSYRVPDWLCLLCAAVMYR